MDDFDELSEIEMQEFFNDSLCVSFISESEQSTDLFLGVQHAKRMKKVIDHAVKKCE